MRYGTIVGYTYSADMMCGDCVVKRLQDRYQIINDVLAVDTELALDGIASMLDIDRDDLYSYDSGDFPKPVLCEQVEEDEHCGECGCEL